MNDFSFDASIVDSKLKELKDKFLNRPSTSRRDELSLLFSCIDNTTLDSKDSDTSVAQFCRTTLAYAAALPHHLSVAAVCLYPKYISLAKSILGADSAIKVASVVGGFPAGQLPLELKLAETGYAVRSGADEVDLVVDRGFILSGHFDRLFDEVAAVKKACGSAVALKVILETGELSSLEQIYHAAITAIDAGADFIKTSTGKIPVGATHSAAFVMLSAIAHYYKKYGKMVGFKAAGGISDIDDALFYLFIAQSFLDTKTVSNQFFRIGTSRLTAQLFNFLSS